MDRALSSDQVPCSEHLVMRRLVEQLAKEQQMAEEWMSKQQMNGSTSEWDFGRILKEFAAPSSKPDETLSSSSSVLRCDGSEIEDHHQNIQSAGLNQISSHTSKPDIGNQQSVAAAPAAINKPAGSFSLPTSYEEFMMFLKNQLGMACAAASTKARYVVGPGSSGPADLAGSHSGSRVLVQGSKDKDTGGSVAILALPAGEKSVAQTEIAASGSEQSDDDEPDGENKMIQDMDPANAKSKKRTLSNREYARRSRKRKQARLTELETQVSELKAENENMSTKYNDAAVDNGVLKAYVERLTAKVSELKAENENMSTKYNDAAVENGVLKAYVERLTAKVSELTAEFSSRLTCLMDMSTKYNDAAVDIGSLLQGNIAEMSEIGTTMPPYSGNTDTGHRTDVAE